MKRVTVKKFTPYFCGTCEKKEFLTQRALNLHNYAHHGTPIPRDQSDDVDDDDDSVVAHEESRWPGDR